MRTKRLANCKQVFRALRVSQPRVAPSSCGSSSGSCRPVLSSSSSSSSSPPSSSSTSTSSDARAPSPVAPGAPLPALVPEREIPGPSLVRPATSPLTAATTLVVIDLSSDSREEMDWVVSLSEDEIDWDALASDDEIDWAALASDDDLTGGGSPVSR